MEREGENRERERERERVRNKERKGHEHRAGIRPNNKICCIALCDRPKNVEIYGRLLNKYLFNRILEKKIYIKAFKTEKYQPKGRERIEKKITKKEEDFRLTRPTFWHLKGNRTFLCKALYNNN